jgi:hypothetical protein
MVIMIPASKEHMPIRTVTSNAAVKGTKINMHPRIMADKLERR